MLKQKQHKGKHCGDWQLFHFDFILFNRASERSEPTSEDNEFVPSASVPRQDPSQIKQPTEKPFNKIVGGIGRGRSRSTNSIPDSVDNISRYSPY